eukprot:TRINITY_DN6713_c0_g1_i1.p1 TRINITY_DN6713_c0_g1~~TRINITY_DN6713_c0_g1_i1.p1  ORF type:complete len:147 (-),score=45.02 TRINITY_DN6713_c0_g1_i1:529-969(-)
MITSVVIGNSSQEVVLSRYYDKSSPQAEKAWESDLLELTAGSPWSEAVVGNEQVGFIREKTVVWCTIGGVTVFVTGIGDYTELVLVEVMEGLISMLWGVCKETVDERVIVAHNHKVSMYLAELITPRGQVQTLDYNDMRVMVKLDL